MSLDQQIASDTLKVGKTLVTGIDIPVNGRTAQTIIKSIVSLRTISESDVVTEEIERPRQAAILRSIGCSHGPQALKFEAQAVAPGNSLARDPG